MSSPLVTIITPTYRHESYIRECIDSVIGQSFENWEQIIVDDCSPDLTFDIAKSYKYPRVKVIQKPVRGGPADLHTSYNTALQMARGDLIAVLEGDDYWPQDKLEIQVPFHQSRNIVMSWGAYDKKRGEALLGIEKRYSSATKIFPNTSYLLIRNIIPALTVMAPAAALRKIGGFWQPQGTVFVDHPTWLRLSRVGDILYIPQLLGIYRLHGGQISQTHQHRMCAFNHDYIVEFMNSLCQEERQKLKVKKIEASRCLYNATILLAEKKYGLFYQQLTRAFCNGDARTKYQCVQTLLGYYRRAN